MKSSSEMSSSQKQVQKFCEDREWDQFHGPKDLSIGLVTEAAELLDIFRFKSDKESMEALLAQRTEISDELADVYFFLLRFSQRFGFDLDKCLEEKMKKTALKYPVETAKGSNIKRRLTEDQ